MMHIRRPQPAGVAVAGDQQPDSAPRRVWIRRTVAAHTMIALAAASIVAATSGPLRAQSGWTVSSDRGPAVPGPYRNDNRGPRGETRPPGFGPSIAPGSVDTGKVQRGELAPIRTGPGDTLPSGVWRGLDVAAIERLITPLELPNRSPQLNQLWRSIMTSRDAPRFDTNKRRGRGSAAQFALLKAEALYRSGQLSDAERLLNAASDRPKSAVFQGIAAHILLARRKYSEGCQAAKEAASDVKRLPRAVRGKTIAIAGFCAVHAGNRAAGKLAAELARHNGYRNRFALALLDAIGRNRRPKLSLPKQLDVIDGLLLEAAKQAPPGRFLERAEPALLAMLATPLKTVTTTNIAAAEQAVRSNVIVPEDLATTYRRYAFSAGAVDDPLSPNIEPALRRAALFQAAERDRTPARRIRLLRALVDDARRYDLTFATLKMIKPLVDTLPRTPEIGWFAETAIESTLAAGDPSAALSWTIFAAALDHNADGTLHHWRSLIEIAHGTGDTHGGNSLASVEALAAHGRFSPEMLQRLATVLDALDYNIPIPLWERASKNPQPKSGHLPPTGVLSQLKTAAANKELARVVLLGLRTIGPDGAPGANILALGECIRALKRAGLEPEARRLAFEALFDHWPRIQVN